MYKLGRKFKYKKVQGGPKEKVEKAEENRREIHIRRGI